MPLLEVKNLKTHFLTPFGAVKAVDGVNFKIEKGKAVGLAGESGCGKTTIGLSILKILPYPGKVLEGEIYFNGIDILKLSDSEFRKIRWTEIATIFQGSLAALNPLFKIGNQIAEPLMIHEGFNKSDAIERAKELLDLVGLDPSRADNYPWELSGGMRQRVSIAMSLVCNPDLLIADEPTTALDVIVASQVLELIKDLSKKLDLSMILITHDISVIAQVCEELMIMYAGKLVEKSSVQDIFEFPIHPYSRALINAFPSIMGERQRLEGIAGSPPDLIDPPDGCRFHPRCPHAQDICSEEMPKLAEIEKDRYVACHLADEIIARR